MQHLNEHDTRTGWLLHMASGDILVGVLQVFQVAGGLGDCGDGQRPGQAMQGERLAGVGQQEQQQVHHMPGLVQNVPLRDVSLDNIAQEFLQRLCGTISEVAGSEPVSKTGRTSHGHPGFGAGARRA
jgi:hypothetical protein